MTSYITALVYDMSLMILRVTFDKFPLHGTNRVSLSITQNWSNDKHAPSDNKSTTTDLSTESSDNDSHHNSTCQLRMASTTKVSNRDYEATSTADDVIHIMSNDKLIIYVHDNNNKISHHLELCLRVCSGRVGLLRLLRFYMNLMGFYFQIPRLLEQHLRGRQLLHPGLDHRF